MQSKAGREKIRAVSKITSCQVYICNLQAGNCTKRKFSCFYFPFASNEIKVARSHYHSSWFSNSPPRIVEFYKQTSTELTMNLLTDVLSAFSWGGQEVSGDLLLLFLHCKRVILCLLHDSLDLSILLTVTGLIIKIIKIFIYPC